MRLLSSLTFLASFTLLHAQGREKTVNTDSGRVVLHYFTTGQLSTKEWMDKDDRWGRSQAYARDGRELINYQTRKIGGHASVDFSYHANGAVSKAEVSDAPDGGIQWYRSTTTFDEHGNRTGFTEQGHDNDGIIPGPGVRVTTTPYVTEPVKQEIVEEQRLFVNEVLVVNSTIWTCSVSVAVAQPSPALQEGSYAIAPGDTIRVGTYSVGEAFAPPETHIILLAQREHRRARKRKPLPLSLLQQEQVSTEHMKYIYHVLPEGTRLNLPK